MESKVQERKNRVGRIDVRFSVDFFKSPAVHTLLTAMPALERSSLLLSLLEEHIQKTKHPAADTEVQLKMVASWLSSGKANGTIKTNAEISWTLAERSVMSTTKTMNVGSTAIPERDVAPAPMSRPVSDLSPAQGNIDVALPDDSAEPKVSQETSAAIENGKMPLSPMVSRWVTE
jgi:hypothetical protein